jgi:hypothetical protein
MARKPQKNVAILILRKIYFLKRLISANRINKEAQSRLTVPIIPFSKIDEMGATMYKGQRSTRDKQAMDATSITAAVQH